MGLWHCFTRITLIDTSTTSQVSSGSSSENVVDKKDPKSSQILTQVTETCVCIYITILYCSRLYYIVVYHILLHTIILYYIISCYIIFCYIVSYCIVLYTYTYTYTYIYIYIYIYIYKSFRHLRIFEHLYI